MAGFLKWPKNELKKQWKELHMVFMMIRRWGWGEGFQAQMELRWFEPPPGAKQESARLSWLAQRWGNGGKGGKWGLRFVSDQRSEHRLRHFMSLFVGIFDKETLVLFHSWITCGTVHRKLLGPFHLLTVFKDNEVISCHFLKVMVQTHGFKHIWSVSTYYNYYHYWNAICPNFS